MGHAGIVTRPVTAAYNIRIRKQIGRFFPGLISISLSCHEKESISNADVGSCDWIISAMRHLILQKSRECINSSTLTMVMRNRLLNHRISHSLSAKKNTMMKCGWGNTYVIRKPLSTITVQISSSWNTNSLNTKSKRKHESQTLNVERCAIRGMWVTPMLCCTPCPLCRCCYTLIFAHNRSFL